MGKTINEVILCKRCLKFSAKEVIKESTLGASRGVSNLIPNETLSKYNEIEDSNNTTK